MLSEVMIWRQSWELIIRIRQNKHVVGVRNNRQLGERHIEMRLLGLIVAEGMIDWRLHRFDVQDYFSEYLTRLRYKC